MIHAVPELTEDLREKFIARVTRADFPRFEAQLRSTGYCVRPIRLKGHVCDRHGEVVWGTDDEPGGVLRKACGNRREAICPSCAEVYRQDAYQLIVAGLRGGKGIPDTVTRHPAAFLTLTAPGFGDVHTQRRDGNGKAIKCRPRRDGEVCEHGVDVTCDAIHLDGDPRLGTPHCRECFEHDKAVTWNNLAGELWRRTTIYLPRTLARLTGQTQKAVKEDVRFSYVKVAEYQARGLIHLHVVIRLDQAMPKYRAEEVHPPSARYGYDLFERASERASDSRDGGGCRRADS